jgi:hypothetical protein
MPTASLYALCMSAATEFTHRKTSNKWRVYARLERIEGRLIFAARDNWVRHWLPPRGDPSSSAPRWRPAWDSPHDNERWLILQPVRHMDDLCHHKLRIARSIPL